MDACLHLAAAVHGSESADADVFRVNVTETVEAARALASSGPLRRFVLASTVAAGALDGEPADTAYARSKAAAEAELAALGRELGFEAPALRLATVYGPSDRGNIGRLFRSVRKRRYVRFVPRGTVKSLVWVESAAAALVAAADPSTPVPPLSIIADPRPYPFEEIEDAMFASAGVPSAPRVPTPIAWLPAAVGTLAERLSGRSAPLSLARLQTLRRPARFLPGPEGPLQDAARAHALPLHEAFRRSYGTPRS